MAVEFLAKALWRSRFVSAAALVASLAACEVGPDYKRPAAEVPPAYKESQGWKIGEPQQAGSDKAWWSIYNDAPLDELETVRCPFEFPGIAHAIERVRPDAALGTPRFPLIGQ